MPSSPAFGARILLSSLSTIACMSSGRSGAASPYVAGNWRSWGGWWAAPVISCCAWRMISGCWNACRSCSSSVGGCHQVVRRCWAGMGWISRWCSSGEYSLLLHLNDELSSGGRRIYAVHTQPYSVRFILSWSQVFLLWRAPVIIRSSWVHALARIKKFAGKEGFAPKSSKTAVLGRCYSFDVHIWEV